MRPSVLGEVAMAPDVERRAVTGSAGPPPERARAAARLGLAGLLAGLALVAAVTPLGGAAHASRLVRASTTRSRSTR